MMRRRLFILPTFSAVHSESVMVIGTKTGVTTRFGNANKANLSCKTNCVATQFKS